MNSNLYIKQENHYDQDLQEEEKKQEHSDWDMDDKPQINQLHKINSDLKSNILKSPIKESKIEVHNSDISDKKYDDSFLSRVYEIWILEAYLASPTWNSFVIDKYMNLMLFLRKFIYN